MEQTKSVKLRGQLERVTFQNEENDYIVARVRVKDRSDLVTVVGNITSPTPGEILDMFGEWITHPKFGEQFKVRSYKTSVPASVAGITKYLGSGLIKGIGPVMAKRIVAKFGERTLEIIEQSVGRLLEIPGIGQQRVDMIGKAWIDQKEIRTVMLFLQSNGISSGYASKIYKQYGKDSIQVVMENPYRLAYDISGIGFIIADQIARKLGFEENSPQRAGAGILYTLFKLTEDGHTFFPIDALLLQASELLGVDLKILEQAIQLLVEEQKIVLEDLNTEEGETTKAVFLTGYRIAEEQIAYFLKNIKNSPKRIQTINPDQALKFVHDNFSLSLADCQKDAIRASLENKVLVITGQPGTGKTTITRVILQIFASFSDRILLAAPTGRAAKRMSEATRHEVKTIHRLLEYNVAKGCFQKNDHYQLDCDLIIIDESSMIDTLLMYHLLKAIPSFATVIFIGDINQLPSVGAGSVLRDVIDSQTFAVIELNEIFRQARKSNIILNAHRINEGKFPIVDNESGSDFYFIEEDDSEKALQKIVYMVKDRIPKKFGYNSMTDIQVLTPMNKSAVGTIRLNEALQHALNPSAFEVTVGIRKFRIADKVMQIKNDYDKDVFNGDIGFITAINSEEHNVSVNIDGREIHYDYTELDELVLAYAVSIHKSQGSEYPVVVIPIVMAHYIMLARNLIYTGVTRGKKLVVLIGSKKALFLAVKNDKTVKRYTRLRERLCK